MRRGQFGAQFLLTVGVVGFLLGAAVSSLVSVSPEMAFFIVLLISTALVIGATRLRRRLDPGDSEDDVRNIATVPVDRVAQTAKNVIASSRSDPESK